MPNLLEPYTLSLAVSRVGRLHRNSELWKNGHPSGWLGSICRHILSGRAISISTQTEKNDSDASPWLPLHNRTYRLFWIASLVSNLGTWMHEIGAGWLMAQLNESPQMVSSVRTAMAMPIVLLAIPAGVLADRLDRRHLLLFTQTLMLVATATLAALTFLGVINEWLLLSLTFLIGLGLTIHVPTWQASIPELVPRVQLSRAIALGSISFNLARAAGPALAGVLIAALGVWIAFTFNALSFAGVIAVLLLWRRERFESTRGLSFRMSLYQGLRYVYRRSAIRNVMISVLLFVTPASALWSLIPLVAKTRLQWGPDGFGLLVALVGAGAVIAARWLPGLQSRFGIERVVFCSMVLFACSLFTMGACTNRIAIVYATITMGGSWMATLTTLNTTAQVNLPSRMRARGMSCYLTVIAIAMASGSLIWGAIAESLDLGSAQKIAAVVLLGTAAIRVRFRLGSW